MITEPSFGYVFPAIRGIQAKREYYVSMCPLRLIPKIFLFDEEELVPELRAQRTLNKTRVPEMSRYLLQHRKDYVFSAITASIDGEVDFKPIGSGSEGRKVGVLHIPMDAKFIINDGQHRRAAIEMALREQPELGDETIAVVFFLDIGLARCQQMFADLNRYAVRPSASLGVLYDHRDDLAKLVKLVVMKSEFFRDIIEMEKSNLSQRSRKLFTLSALYHATCSLLDDLNLDAVDQGFAIATEYWESVASHFPEWALVRERKMSAGEVRRDFIHSHGIVLQALGIIGNKLIRENGSDWKARLNSLQRIDWTRANSKLWEGRAMIGGRVSKAGHNVSLTTNAIKHALKMELSPEENRVENALMRKNHGKK